MSLAGRTKTLLYRRPKDLIAQIWRFGPRAYFSLNRWQQNMEQAARELQPPEFTESEEPISLWFLTGSNFWYQTAFCAWSFSRQSSLPVELNLIDDGTLKPEQTSNLRRLFPTGQTVDRSAAQARMAKYLPPEDFPVLNQRWNDYINIRKLTDIHLGSTGVKVVLDSDMLFFHPPTELVSWVKNPDQPTMVMTDCEESYGYSRKILHELSGTELPPLLNVGVTGLSSEALDWEELEQWCEALVEREGTSYYLEQALIAMLAARSGVRVLSADKYLTFPRKAKTLAREGVLHHFVAESKAWYFERGWRLAMK